MFDWVLITPLLVLITFVMFWLMCGKLHRRVGWVDGLTLGASLETMDYCRNMAISRLIPLLYFRRRSVSYSDRQCLALIYILHLPFFQNLCFRDFSSYLFSAVTEQVCVKWTTSIIEGNRETNRLMFWMDWYSALQWRNCGDDTTVKSSTGVVESSEILWKIFLWSLFLEKLPDNTFDGVKFLKKYAGVRPVTLLKQDPAGVDLYLY